jgi:outer membrane protein TolC
MASTLWNTATSRGMVASAATLATVVSFASVGCVASRTVEREHAVAATPIASPPPSVASPPPPALQPLPNVETAISPLIVDEGVQLAAADDNDIAAASLAQPLSLPTPVALQQPAELLPPVAANDAVENAVEVDAAQRSPAATLTINLPTALAITTGENPQVAYAQQRIQESFAKLQAANVLWVPTLNAGMNYNKHEGVIQDVAGNMIDTSRGSVYNGLGAQAVGAGSPAVPGLLMNFQLRDALYQPRINERLLAASRQASRATTNDMLLETALAYNDLLEALQIEAVARNTLQHAKKLADVTGEFARVGEGLASDADRAQAELAAREIDVLQTLEGSQVASVRLARVMSQDPAIQLTPEEPVIIPINLAPVDSGLPELIATGLANRPELAESRQLVGAAAERLRSEVNAPLIPSVLLGLSYGGNGGGLGDDISNYGDRMDFDAVAFWQVRNLGWGEQAARNEARARVEQARWREVRILDQVASEVAESYAQAISRRGQIEVAQAGITAAQESYRRNIDRTLNAQGLPIESLQALQALDAAQRQYVRSVADYNRAQFRLQRALGWPVL